MRAIVVYAVQGAVVGLSFVIGLLATDALGLATLLLHDTSPALAFFALSIPVMSTFSAAAIGTGLMLDSRQKD